MYLCSKFVRGLMIHSKKFNSLTALCSGKNIRREAHTLLLQLPGIGSVFPLSLSMRTDYINGSAMNGTVTTGTMQSRAMALKKRVVSMAGF